MPPGQEVSAANSPRSPRTPRLSPRSLALHTPRAKKEAKRRWKLVKKNLYRLVQEEREKLGVTVVGGGGGGKRFSSQMWSVATEDWEERSVENALRSFKPLQPLTEMELRVLLQYSSLTTIARYAKVHQKGLPLTQCFLVLQGRCGSRAAEWGREAAHESFLRATFAEGVRGCLARRSTRTRRPQWCRAYSS